MLTTAARQMTDPPLPFEQFIALPENTHRTFEMINGEIVEKMATNPYCSLVAARIVARMLIFVEERDLGYVTGADGGYIIDAERHYFVPDAAYISKARQPELPSQGHNPVPPDLAVEVLSPTDAYTEVLEKVNAYLERGTQAVWVFDPQTRRAAVHTGQGIVLVKEDQAIDGGEVLPGFSLKLVDVFGQPPQPQPEAQPGSPSS